MVNSPSKVTATLFLCITRGLFDIKLNGGRYVLTCTAKVKSLKRRRLRVVIPRLRLRVDLQKRKKKYRTKLVCAV